MDNTQRTPELIQKLLQKCTTMNINHDSHTTTHFTNKFLYCSIRLQINNQRLAKSLTTVLYRSFNNNRQTQKTQPILFTFWRKRYKKQSPKTCISDNRRCVSVHKHTHTQWCTWTCPESNKFRHSNTKQISHDKAARIHDGHTTINILSKNDFTFNSKFYTQTCMWRLQVVYCITVNSWHYFEWTDLSDFWSLDRLNTCLQNGISDFW